MINRIQSGVSWTDTLKARKNHLTELLKIVDTKAAKATKVQTLTINLIKAEMSHVESQLKGRQ